MPRREKRGHGVQEPGGVADPRVCLRHQAFRFAPDWATGQTAPEGGWRSPVNLRGEAEVLRFAVGLFSALAFLEAEGWPWMPAPEEWALDQEGRPSLLSPPAGELGTPPVPGHAGLLFSLLAGKAPPPVPPWPSVPRRHRHFALWNAWLSTASQDDGCGLAPCRELLQGLWALARETGLRPGIPASWGVGVLWAPLVERWTAGWHEVTGSSTRSLEGALALALHPAGRPPLLPVFLGEPPPYPYAALEPAVAAALGDPAASRAWMRERLAEGGETVLEGMKALLRSPPGAGGWFVWPARALDPESRRVLRAAADGLDRPLVLAGEGPGAPAGEPRRLHLLWLPETAQAWYLQHAEALLGPGREELLRALESLPPDSPRTGSPLVPPLPDTFRKAHRPTLGIPPPRAAGALGEPGAPGEADPPEVLAERGELAALLASARALRASDGAAGLFWEGVFFLLSGQAQQALDLWEKIPPGSPFTGKLAVFRARAYERFLDYRSARRCLEEVESTPLDEATGNLRDLAKAQFLWVEKRAEEAEALLERVAARTADPDARAQALCHRATVALDANELERAFGLLQGAREAAPREPEPLTSFLLLHRQAKAWRKTGQFERALAGFRSAGELAARHGFRALEAGCEVERGDTLRVLCRLPEAASSYRRAAEGASALGLPGLEDTARTGLAICQAESGDLVSARRFFDASLQRSAGGQNALYRATDQYWLAAISQRLGDLPGALDLAEAGLASLEGHEDPEVRLPLLVLRGECLLLTGQDRKLAFLLRELREEIRPETEADDRIAALALRRAAARRGAADFSAEEEAEAIALLPSCSPDFRAYWHLLPAEVSRGGGSSELTRAWEEARAAASPYLAGRALLALSERSQLPLLAQEDKRWLGGFLTGNPIRGPLRDLLPLLGDGGPARPRSRPALPDDLALLASAAEPSEEALEALLARIACEGACVLLPGRPPLFAGPMAAETRRALLAAAGSECVMPCPGGLLLGRRGREGIWCGFFKRGREPFPETGAALAGLWSKLLPLPAGADEPKPAQALHPALSRHVLTRSPAMVKVLEEIQRAAPFRFPVLFTGEAGVGKEACALALHAVSPRGAKAWVPYNCANLSPTLATSQLFGHKRGSFTGADKDQAGLVEAARGSTLFLDEVGELPGEVQPHLLRYLQDGTYLPLGEVRTRESDARVVAATNRDLEGAVAQGRFREDLFHRLNVIRVEIPPLRERPEDIPLLFGYFLEAVAREQGIPAPEADPAVLGRLGAHTWPGNVRELQNLAKKLLVASHPGGRIREEHLPASLLKPSRPGGGRTLEARLREAESAAILEALRGCGGNAAAAARELGLSRQGLFAKMKRLGLK